MKKFLSGQHQSHVWQQFIKKIWVCKDTKQTVNYQMKQRKKSCAQRSGLFFCRIILRNQQKSVFLHKNSLVIGKSGVGGRKSAVSGQSFGNS